MKSLLILFVPLLLVSACSDDESAVARDEASYSGMVESQTEAMKKARAVEGALQATVKKRAEESGQ